MADIKMSETICVFAQPLLKKCPDRYRKIIPLAITVWNLTLLPKSEHKGTIEKMLKSLCGDNTEMREVMENTIRFLMQRKEKHFADNMNMIVDYKIRDKKGSYDLTVKWESL